MLSVAVLMKLLLNMSKQTPSYILVMLVSVQWSNFQFSMFS